MVNYNIATPVGKVEIALSPIAAYVSEDPSKDYTAPALCEGQAVKDSKNVFYDPHLESLTRRLKRAKRDTYIYSNKISYAVSQLYPDSNLEAETNRRIFEPYPTGAQLLNMKYIKEKFPEYMFIAPDPTKRYPSEYKGPRWSMAAFQDDITDNIGVYDAALSGNESVASYKKHFVYTPISQLHGGSQIAPIRFGGPTTIRPSNFGQSYWITQNTVGHCPWGVKQLGPNFRNQSFTLYVKKARATAIPNLPTYGVWMKSFQANGGPHLAIFIGGGPKSFEDEEKLSQPPLPLPGSPGTPEAPKSTDSADKPKTPSPSPENDPPINFDTSSAALSKLAFVFPIGEKPYVLFTETYYKGSLAEIKDPIYEFTLKDHILDLNEDEEWILHDANEEFDITFRVLNGKIILSSSFATNPWIFSFDTDTVYKKIFWLKTGKKLSPFFTTSPIDFELPEVPIEIQGAGIKCSLNFTPTEYFYPAFNNGDNSNDTSPETFFATISEDSSGNKKVNINSRNPYIDFSYMTYTTPINGFGGMSLTTWSGITSSPDAFLVPGNNGALFKYGYDYDPLRQATSQGLHKDSLQLLVNKDFASDEMPDDLFDSPGMKTVLKANNPLSAYTRYRQYRVVFDDSAPVVDTMSGSRAYRTPVFNRLKLKGRVNGISPEGIQWLDITNHVQKISYDSKMEGPMVKKNITLDLILPKRQADSRANAYPIPDKMFWADLKSKNFLVRVFAGMDPDNPNVPSGLEADWETPFFTGIAFGGDMTYTNAKDSFSIKSSDMTEVLKDIVNIHSPHYDGMDLTYAVATALERGGFSALSSIETGMVSDSSLLSFSIAPRALPLSKGWVLPDSLTMTPSLKFEPGKPIYDIIKDFVNRFWLTFRAAKEGGFQLDCWPGATTANTYSDPGSEQYNNVRYQPTNNLLPGAGTGNNPLLYVYRSVPTAGTTVMTPNHATSHYFLLRESKTIRIKPSKWINMLGMRTIDKMTGNLHMMSHGSPDLFANTQAPNFIGFMKAGFIMNPGYGSKMAMMQTMNLLKNMLFYPVTIVSAKIWGNKLLEPLDIIRIDSNNYRITSISASITVDGYPEFSMDIVAENMGYNYNNEDALNLFE